ncbi:DNA-binding protein [Candidatus Marsarchaeota archaeon]|nr:DNA-binding protein [Candidatus Marsarchaeota archaeon]
MSSEEQQEKSNDDKVKEMISKRMKALQIEQQKKEMLKKIMSNQAYERLMNVRVANYDLYSQVVDLLIAMARSNRITSQITDDQLKSILAKVTYKPDTKIEFKHK